MGFLTRRANAVQRRGASSGPFTRVPPGENSGLWDDRSTWRRHGWRGSEGHWGRRGHLCGRRAIGGAVRQECL